MSKRRAKAFLIVVILLLLAGIPASQMVSGGSAGGTLASDRSVVTHSDSFSLSSTFTSDTATIETAGKKIVVQPTSLVVDGVVVATIDADVSEVQVRVKQGVVTFEADGTRVVTSR